MINTIKNVQKHTENSRLYTAALALVASFATCGVILFFLGFNPFQVYRIIYEGSFGSFYSISKSLAKCTPLIFTGLSVFFATKAGLFNIGAEGQLLIGGIAAGIAGNFFSSLSLNPVIAITFTLLVSFLAGALWGAIPGILKAYYQANEFIVSMMMNYIALYFCEYLVTYPFRGDGVLAKTPEIPNDYLLPRLLQGSQLNFGFFLGIIAIIVVFLYFKYSASGFELKAMGLNKSAAEAAGVNLKHKIVFAFFFAGGLAALAGATEVLGVHGFYINNLSPGYGYDGIAVSVLAQGNTISVLLSAILFGALRAGGSRLDLKSMVPSEFVIILQAVVIVFIATPELLKFRKERRLRND